MFKKITCFLFLFPTVVFGQYPFEKFRAPSFTSAQFKIKENENALEYSSKIKSFFNDKTDLEILVYGNLEDSKGTFLQIGTSKKSKKYYEEINPNGIEGLFIADFNGDGMKDAKIVCFYMGSGLASMNVRVFYFFQKSDKEFTKISFDDKMDSNRFERDINGDGNFEIITQTLKEYNSHSYWVFNVYNFKNDRLVCVNSKMNYPIMIQFLYHENFTISKKISRLTLKAYQSETPDAILIDK
jgi:hypothetical protein